jgi:hypothetical protein
MSPVIRVVKNAESRQEVMKKQMPAISRSIYTCARSRVMPIAAARFRFSQASLVLFALSLRTGQAIEFCVGESQSRPTVIPAKAGIHGDRCVELSLNRHIPQGHK